MEKMSPDTFKERLGEHTAIAALAVIVEDEALLHRIKCRDKLRAPGAREKKQLLLEAMERKEFPFLIVGDIKKAHRRFKHLAKEHGFLACQLDSRDGPEGQLDDSCVYCQQGWHLWRQLRQLLVDQDSRLWGQGHTARYTCCFMLMIWSR